jgi:hypothetical protein
MQLMYSLVFLIGIPLAVLAMFLRGVDKTTAPPESKRRAKHFWILGVLAVVAIEIAIYSVVFYAH